jgi:DNA processing protein
MAVGIVGTRRASSYGRRATDLLATGLAKAGVTVVSGLARGIDTVAHQAALAAGGRTIAVIAGGLLEITPVENLALADRVAEQGFLVSESPPRRPAVAGSFPQRNRLISGLVLGVVVVEADDRSGALITARHAGEQGRDVFAVPGPIDQRTSRGCHRLIQDGAKLVTCVDDILDELSSLIKPVETTTGSQLRHVAEIKLNDIERRILDAIDSSATQIDDIVERANLPVHQVLSTVSVLEMRRLVRRLSGTQVMRV